MSNKLYRWEVGVGFFKENTMQHVGSTVWYIHASTFEEAEVLLESRIKVYCDKYSNEFDTFEGVHEWISSVQIDSITHQTKGKSTKL